MNQSDFQLLFKEDSNENPVEFLDKLQKKRNLILNNIEELKLKLKRSQYQFKILKSTTLIDPELMTKNDSQWSILYQCYCSYYQNKVNTFSSSFNIQDLNNFQNEITEKLKKQTARLQKIQHYSKELRETYENQQNSRALHRQKRLDEANNIYKQFIIKIKNENARHYEQRIQQITKSYTHSSEILSSLNAKCEILEKEKHSIEKENQDILCQINDLKSQLEFKENQNEISWKDIQNKSNYQKLTIQKLKNEKSILNKEIENLNSIIKLIHTSQNQIEMSVSIAQSIFDSN